MKNKTYLVGVVLFFFIFPVLSFLVRPFAHNEISAFFCIRLTYWLCLATLYFYSKKIEKGNFFIWPERPHPGKFYLLSVVALLVSSFLALGAVDAILPFNSQENANSGKAIYTMLQTNKFALIAGALTAGFTEELIFRAYLLPRLNILSGSRAISIIVSALMFSAIHIQYHSYAKCVYTFFLGVFCAFHYDRFRNIKTLIFFHCLLDFIP